jgi:hypothetical protein
MITGWSQGVGVVPAYDRIVKSVFKAAWKERTFTLDCGEAPLKAARSYRDSIWWETIQALAPTHKRRKVATHASSGQQKRAWEHPFCTVWGNSWRAKLESCGSLSEWMNHYNKFAASLYGIWSLPVSHLALSWEAQSEPLLIVKLSTTVDDVPPLLPNPKETMWGGRHSRVWIQTDNKQLDELFGGSSQLDQLHHRPLCVRIAKKLYSLLEVGRKPRDDVANFIEWDPRDYNAVSDHAANCALSMCAPWVWKDEEGIQHARQSRSNIRICMDGARKRTGRSSGGMVLYAYHEDEDKQILYRAGIDFGILESAFLAEAMALDWALDILFSIVS